MPKKRWPSILAALFMLVYLAVLLRLTVLRPGFWPLHLFVGSSINWVPLQDPIRIWQRGYTQYCLYLVLGNIGWFVPLGAYVAALSTSRRLGAAALAGFGLSLCIEASQFILGTGVSELDDLLLNTLGALLGGICACAWLALRRRHRAGTSH